MKDILRFNFLLIFLFFISCKTSKPVIEITENKFEKEILALEQKDRSEVDNGTEVLFVGSSSIRLWKNLNKDIAPFKGIQRGFGGANFTDLNYYASRLVYPHKFQAIVVFIANDIVGSELDKSPDQVLGLFKDFERIVRKKFRKQPIFFIAITPTPLRWKYWPQQSKANRLIEEYCNSKSNLKFIKTEHKYINPSTHEPIGDYFIGDKLHQNAKGYEVWSAIIKESLANHLK